MSRAYSIFKKKNRYFFWTPIERSTSGVNKTFVVLAMFPRFENFPECHLGFLSGSKYIFTFLPDFLHLIFCDFSLKRAPQIVRASVLAKPGSAHLPLPQGSHRISPQPVSYLKEKAFALHFLRPAVVGPPGSVGAGEPRPPHDPEDGVSFPG